MSDEPEPTVSPIMSEKEEAIRLLSELTAASADGGDDAAAPVGGFAPPRSGSSNRRSAGRKRRRSSGHLPRGRFCEDVPREGAGIWFRAAAFRELQQKKRGPQAQTLLWAPPPGPVL